jgi:hypothetical protein
MRVKRGNKTKQQELEMELFQCQENLRSIVRDLEHIDILIPAESSRHGSHMNRKTHGEEMAIIEARKSVLLGYIQVICRDHIRWSKRLLGENL